MIGQQWLDLYKANAPLTDYPTFLAVAGLVEASPVKLSIAFLEALLKNCGPIWLEVSWGGQGFTRILTGLHGDSTAAGIRLVMFDPASGRSRREPFRDFEAKLRERHPDGSLAQLHVIHLPPGSRGVKRPAPKSIAEAQVPAAVATVVGVGYTIVSEALQNKGDITWRLVHMTGAKHPWDQKKRYDKPPWPRKKIKVSAWCKNLLGDRISADFEVEFRYNGHSVGSVTMQNKGTNDAALWGLDVRASIMPDRDAYKGKDGKPVAAIEVTFNYRFTRSLGADAIWIGRYRLRGDGSWIAMGEQWNPIVNAKMEDVGLYRTYNRMAGVYNSLPFTRRPAIDLDEYLTERALDGLFTTLAEEETKIRQDPVAASPSCCARSSPGRRRGCEPGELFRRKDPHRRQPSASSSSPPLVATTCYSSVLRARRANPTPAVYERRGQLFSRKRCRRSSSSSGNLIRESRASRSWLHPSPRTEHKSLTPRSSACRRAAASASARASSSSELRSRCPVAASTTTSS